MVKTFIKSLAVAALCTACASSVTPLADLESIKEAKVFDLDSPEVAALSAADPLFAKAFSWLEKNDIDNLPLGRQDIDGDNLFINVQEVCLKTVEDGLLEAHDAYYDIQIPITASEKFGIRKREELTMPRGEMDEAKDIIFYDDTFADNIVEVQPKQVIIFAPHSAHAPCLGEGSVRKAVFKVKVRK